MHTKVSASVEIIIASIILDIQEEPNARKSHCHTLRKGVTERVSEAFSGAHLFIQD